LKSGKNEVIIFDLMPGASAPKLHGLARPILDDVAATAEQQ
jgi:hypothetical protein